MQWTRNAVFSVAGEHWLNVALNLFPDSIVISLVSEYHHHPSVRRLVIHQDIWLGQIIVHVHNSEKHLMKQVVYTFWDKKYTNCFVAIKADNVFSSIITTNIQTILESTNAPLCSCKKVQNITTKNTLQPWHVAILCSICTVVHLVLQHCLGTYQQWIFPAFFAHFQVFTTAKICFIFKLCLTSSETRFFVETTYRGLSEKQRWPESLFQTPTPLLFQNIWIRVREYFKFGNPTPVQIPATIIDPPVIYPCFYLRNDHTDSCYCRNGKVTPDPGPVFHKCLTPDPGPKEKRRILRDPVPSLVRSGAISGEKFHECFQIQKRWKFCKEFSSTFSICQKNCCWKICQNMPNQEYLC